MKLLSREKLLKIAQLLLNPLVRFCIQKGIRFQDFTDLAKQTFIYIAKEEIESKGQKITSSRLSAMTGLQRRETSKSDSIQYVDTKERDLIIKVIGLWQTGKDFITKSRDPRVLSYIGDNSEFAHLVKRVSKDINSATVLFELERLNLVERTERGIKLILDTVSPREDIDSGIAILGKDINDLCSAVEENLLDRKELPNLHVRTHYDSIRSEDLPEIKSWLLKEGHSFHARVRDFVSQYDQDINPKLNYKGKRALVTIGAFSFTGEKK